MGNCTTCGMQLNNGDAFCTGCGTKIDVTAGSAHSPSHQHPMTSYQQHQAYPPQPPQQPQVYPQPPQHQTYPQQPQVYPQPPQQQHPQAYPQQTQAPPYTTAPGNATPPQSGPTPYGANWQPAQYGASQSTTSPYGSQAQYHHTAQPYGVTQGAYYAQPKKKINPAIIAGIVVVAAVAVFFIFFWNSSDLIGTWEMTNYSWWGDERMVVEFQRDGNGHIRHYVDGVLDYRETFRWNEISSGMVEVISPWGREISSFRVVGNILEVDGERFTRVR